VLEKLQAENMTELARLLEGEDIDAVLSRLE
jgi:hypothetical protein